MSSKQKQPNRNDFYGDEGNLTHYLGNDDYAEGNKEPSDDWDNSGLDGFEAAGNDLKDEEDEEEANRQAVQDEIDRMLSLHTD